MGNVKPTDFAFYTLNLWSTFVTYFSCDNHAIFFVWSQTICIPKICFARSISFIAKEFPKAFFRLAIFLKSCPTINMSSTYNIRMRKSSSAENLSQQFRFYIWVYSHFLPASICILTCCKVPSLPSIAQSIHTCGSHARIPFHLACIIPLFVVGICHGFFKAFWLPFFNQQYMFSIRKPTWCFSLPQGIPSFISCQFWFECISLLVIRD